MAAADSHHVAQTRSVSGLQHGFLQLRRRMEGSPPESVRTKHIMAMKFSTEAIVAAVVAVVFAVITLGAIAQEQSEHRTAGLNRMSASGSEISLAVQNGSSENQLLAQY
jgi:hypothetical protein